MEHVLEQAATGERDYTRIANGYSRDIISGKILSGELIRAACVRHRDDMAVSKTDKNYLYAYDAKLADRACRFIERLPHIKGELAKRSIVLEPWQCWIVCTFFGWVRKSGGKRRFRRAYVEVARKNGKSSLSSAIALYCLAADGEEGAEVYAVAVSRDQAGIVFKDAQAMVRLSPGLRRHLGVESLAAAITVSKKNSTFRSLPGDPGDGTNPHCAIVDEYHEHKSSAAYDAMYGGMGARSQPIMWVITTAGTNRSGACYQLREYAKKVLTGVAVDESLFAAIYTLDAGDDWTDSRTWIKANPNLGVSVDLGQMREACGEARHSTRKQGTFKTKRLNIWLGAGDAWMNMLEWDRNADKTLQLENYYSRPIFIGLDLASKIDIAAMEILIPDGDGYVRFGKYYMPEDTVRNGAEKTHAQYAAWELDGWVTLTPGNIIDFALIKEDIEFLCSNFQVECIGYDPFQATQLATELLKNGVPMVEVRQNVQTFSAPMKEVEALVKSGRLRHGGDPVMTWMMSNVVAHTDNKDNIYPRKAVAENKIDGAIALIMATAMAMRPVEDKLEAGIFLL